MILSFLTNKIALIGIAFVIGGAVGWHQKSLRVPALLEAQRQADAKACNEAQTITKEKNDALVSARDRIASDLARFKRLQPDACLNLAVDGKLYPNTGEHAGVHGINTATLREYAALCETYRSELMVCSNQ